jgi:hypothetical protein
MAMANVDPMAASEMLSEVGAVQRRVRGDRRATSVPLVVFGVLTVTIAVLGPKFVWAPALALFFLAPLGFLVVAIIYKRREISLGVGGRAHAYKVAAITTLLALPFLGFFVGEYAVIGLALLIIAILQRNPTLGLWAVVFGVIGGLERFYLLSNRLYPIADALGVNRNSDGYFSWGSALVYGCLGIAMIAGGLYTRHREGA